MNWETGQRTEGYQYRIKRKTTNKQKNPTNKQKTPKKIVGRRGEVADFSKILGGKVCD